MIARRNLPTNTELMPAMSPAPAHLVAAVERTEAALNAVRAKRDEGRFANNSSASEAFYNELRPAIAAHAKAVAALAEHRRQQALEMLIELRSELPALEEAWHAADMALRSQQRRIELIAQAAQSAQADIEDAERRQRMVAPPQPVRGESQRIHIGQASTEGVSLWA